MFGALCSTDRVLFSPATVTVKMPKKDNLVTLSVMVTEAQAMKDIAAVTEQTTSDTNVSVRGRLTHI